MSFSHSDLDPLIGIIRDVAKAEILPRFRNLDLDEIDTKADPHDLVTVADRAAENAISEAVQDIFTGITIVGEEAVTDDPTLLAKIGTSDLCLILDPIDGTGNFVSGLTVFGTIAALTVQGETVAGILYDPIMDDWVLATKGGGAWLCSSGSKPKKLTTRSARQPEKMEGFVSVGNSVASDTALSNIGQVRALRCSCHEYRALVMGGIDFNLSAALMPWDHAAGSLAVLEAGGCVEVLGGKAYAPTMTQGPIWATANPECLTALKD